MIYINCLNKPSISTWFVYGCRDVGAQTKPFAKMVHQLFLIFLSNFVKNFLPNQFYYERLMKDLLKECSYIFSLVACKQVSFSETFWCHSPDDPFCLKYPQLYCKKKKKTIQCIIFIKYSHSSEMLPKLLFTLFTLFFCNFDFFLFQFENHLCS